MAPKAEKKPAKKVAKTAKTGAKKKSKAKVESFKIYIYKVLKQVRRLSALWLNGFALPAVQQGVGCGLTSRNSTHFKHLHWAFRRFSVTSYYFGACMAASSRIW